MLSIKIQNDKLEMKGEADSIQLMSLIGSLLIELKEITGFSKEKLIDDISTMTDKVEELMKTKEK